MATSTKQKATPTRNLKGAHTAPAKTMPARARTAAPAGKATSVRAQQQPSPAPARTPAPAKASAGDFANITVRLPLRVAEAVRREAKRNATSVSGYACEVLASAVSGSKPASVAAGARRTGAATGARAGSKGPTRGRSLTK